MTGSEDPQGLRALLEALDTPAFAVDPNLNFLGFNRRFAEHPCTEEGAAPTLGASALASAPEEARDRLRADLERSLAGHAVHRERVCRGNVLEWSFGPLQDADGYPWGVLVVQRDISRGLHAESIQLGSERRFRALFEQAGAGVVMVEPHSRRFLEVNRTFCGLMGRSAEELLGQDVLALTCPEDRDQDRALFGELAAGLKTGFSVERRYLHKEGAPLWVELHVTRLDLGGGTFQCMGVVHDITARRQAALALEESERRFRTLANNLPVVVARLDPQGRCLYVNPAIAGVIGLEPEAFQGLSAEGPLGPETAVQAWQARVQAALETGTIQEFELELVGPAGARTLALILVSERGTDTAEPTVLNLGLDITRRKETERALAAQLDELTRWHTVTLGREGRVLELKREVNRLLAEYGGAPRYPSAETAP